MALLYKGKGLDLMRGISIDIVNSMETAPDIHRIFPQSHCVKTGYERHKWNSVINKMPLLPESDREIGGLTPSVCSAKFVKKVKSNRVNSVIESNLIDWDAFINDDFDAYFKDRAMALLDAIEFAMGKSISDRGTEETVKRFGCPLE